MRNSGAGGWQQAGESALGMGGGASGMPWGQMMGGLGSALGGMLGSSSSQDPMDAAQQYMGQIPGTLQQYLGSYSQMGQQLAPELQSMYTNIAQNPDANLAQLGAGFHQDPGYQYNLNQQLQAGNQAAAAGGMAGSPAAQQQAQQTASGLANQGYQQYLQNAMGQQNLGLQGMGGLEQQGFGASQDISQMLSDMMMSQAQMAAAQAEQNQSSGSGLGSTIGGILGMAGGAALGGPLGAGIGGSLGSSIGGSL